MQRGRIIFTTAALMLAAASAWGQTTFKDVVNLDFATVDQNQPGVTVNGFAYFVTPSNAGGIAPPTVKQALRLTDAGNETSSFFLPTPMGLSDYQVQFDFQVQPPTAGATGNAIADGFAFVAQSHSDSAIGGGGGSIGYIGAGISQWDYNYAVDFNTYPPNGIPTVNNRPAVPEIVSLDLGFPLASGSSRTKLFPTALPLVGQGVIHAAIRVTPDKITATFTGGKIPADKPIVWSAGLTGVFKPLGSDGKPLPLYFGISAATGGSSMVLDIYNFRLQVPA